MAGHLDSNDGNDVAVPAAMSDLSEVSQDHDSEPLDTLGVAQAFEINSPRTANWLVRRVTECRRYREHVRAWAAGEVNRAEREERQLLERFGSQLERWLRGALMDQGGRRRSVHLPAGVVGLRAEPARLLVTDEVALSNWCRRHLVDALQIRVEAAGGDALGLERWTTSNCAEARAVVAVAKAIVNHYFASSGELPDGTQVLPRQDALTIK